MTDSTLESIPQPTLVVDAKGLRCPLPILKAKKALTDLQAGDVLEVQTTDHSALRDFQAFCKQTGNPLLLQKEEGEVTYHYLARRA